MANDKTKALQGRTIEVQVAKRRSLDVDGKLYGPGAKVTLPMDEAKSLYDKGFIVEPDGDDDDTGPTTADSDSGAGPSLQTGDQGQ